MTPERAEQLRRLDLAIQHADEAIETADFVIVLMLVAPFVAMLLLFIVLLLMPKP